MLNKNIWSVKKCRANQKQHCKQAGLATLFRTIDYYKCGQVIKPIILVKICYNIVWHSRSYKYLIK